VAIGTRQTCKKSIEVRNSSTAQQQFKPKVPRKLQKIKLKT